MKTERLAPQSPVLAHVTHRRREGGIAELVLPDVEGMVTRWIEKGPQSSYGFLKMSFASVEKLREHLALSIYSRGEIERMIDSGVFMHCSS